MRKNDRFEELYGKYAKFAHFRAWHILKKPEGVEDVLQEAWLRVYRNMDKICEADDARARYYIGVVVRNECLRFLEKNNPRIDVMELREDGLYEIEDHSASVEREIMSRAGMEELEAALRTLGETERQIFIMRHAEGMKNVEIAKILGKDAGYVGVKLARAMKKIAKKLAEPEGLEDWMSDE